MLTILSGLTFNSDGFFNVGLVKNLVVGQVVANGVTINSAASFAFSNNRGATSSCGTRSGCEESFVFLAHFDKSGALNSPFFWVLPDKESAMLATLEPGNYTAIVRG